MVGVVYIIRNGDLYKIGHAKNIESEIRKLKPDEIIARLEVDEPKELEVRLFKRYKLKRVPDTDYFRLTDDQVLDCKKRLAGGGSTPLTLKDEIRICFNASFVFALIAFFVFKIIGLETFYGLSLTLVIASLPMWLLCLFGSFGGYDIDELPIFSTWTNRIKSFLIAIAFDCIAYVLFDISRIFLK